MSEALLKTAMQVAVPLWQDKLQIVPLSKLLAEGPEIAQALGSKGDLLMYKSKKKGETAAIFNKVARGLAIMSFMPGGVTFLGCRWEANHQNKD